MPPWEKYQSAESSGPWSKYAQGASPSQPATTPVPMTQDEADASSVGGRFFGAFTGPAKVLMKMVGPDSIKQQIADIEAVRQRGKEKRGIQNDVDLAAIAGTIPSGVMAGNIAGKAISAAHPILRGMLGGGLGAAAQPVQGPDELSMEKVAQVGTGTALGWLIPGAVEGVKKIGGVIGKVTEPLRESGRENILRNFWNTITPEEARPGIRQAVQTAQEYTKGSAPTVGEAVSEIPEAASLAAHQKMMTKLPYVHELGKRFAGQEQARMNALSPIAGTADDLAAAVKERAALTGPMREAALTRANEAGKQLPGLEKTIVKAERGIERSTKQLGKIGPPAPKADPDALRSAVEIHGVPPKPLLSQQETTLKSLLPEQIAARKSEIDAAREAISALEQNGLKPLTADNLMKGLKMRLGAPEIRASDVASKTLAHLENKLQGLKSKHGTIDAFDLYMVRKELGNNIEQFSKDTSTFDKRFTSKLLMDTQSAIDEAIERAGGTGWREYLKEYGRLSQGPNRMEAGQKLMEALRNPLDTGERAQMFARAASDVRPGALSATDEGTVAGIVKDLSRRDAYTKLASTKSLPGHDAIPGRIDLHLPNLLSRTATVANAMMKMVGESGEQKIAKLADKAFTDPQTFLRVFGDQPPARYKPLLDALTQQAAGVAGATAGRNY